MNILIYRRTHHGDPCECGIFGIRTCMKQVRSWNYNMVIGIGGKTFKGQTGMITWVGAFPIKEDASVWKKRGRRGPRVKFKYFKFMKKPLKKVSKKLHNYIFNKGKIPHAGYLKDIDPKVEKFVKKTFSITKKKEEVKFVKKEFTCEHDNDKRSSKKCA